MVLTAKLLFLEFLEGMIAWCSKVNEVGGEGGGSVVGDATCSHRVHALGAGGLSSPRHSSVDSLPDVMHKENATLEASVSSPMITG